MAKCDSPIRMLRVLSHIVMQQSCEMEFYNFINVIVSPAKNSPDLRFTEQ